jgi:hypothetical protein
MTKTLLTALMCLLLFNIAEAQRAKIVNEAVTPHRLTTLGLPTNSVSTGLDIVGNQTYVYLSALNIGNSDPILNASFTVQTKPTGSTVTLTQFGPEWVYFRPDVKGEYTIGLTITTATGSHDTTKKIVAADFVGVGNFEGVAGSFPKCMTCHASSPKFAEIFDRWKVSGHAQIFKSQITTGSAYYSTSCIKCHTTGYDHSVTAANGGFDDVAATLGWVWQGPPNPGKWDTLKTQFPGLVNLATIGCESCHGAGSEHSSGGSITKIQISNESGVCAQCHDEPWRHNKYSEWENSLHSEALWSSSFAQGAASQNNNLQNCIRCHDGKGYINFTKGVTTNTTGMVGASQTKIGCSTCHDPHGNSNTASLRNTPAGSDTLANGYQYTMGGMGRTCLNCHKARRDNVTYVQTNVTSSHWGTHHSVQGDVVVGQNAAEFGTPFLSSPHYMAVQDLCVTCHMVATVDTGNVNRDKVGGHTFSLHNEVTGYDHTASCTPCHGPRANFGNAFMAASDYDGDGNIESVRDEIAGLEQLLRIWLPPVGIDSISYALIGQNNNLNEKKAYFNYQLIAYDGSGGMHNAKYAIDVLTKSILAIGGNVPVQMVSFTAEASGKSVTLNWQTATETNNKGFEIERKTGSSFESVAFVTGHGTTLEAKTYTYTDLLSSNIGTVAYRLKQIDYDGSYQYSHQIEIELDGPAVYQLSQNYPNPFNPSTRFSYTIPVESMVKVRIFNISGEMVGEVVNSTQAAGRYDVEFNANSLNSSLSSGIYFYSIEAVAADGSRTFKETKKMVLLK